MPEAIDLSYAITQPPREVIRYFKSKGYVISWDWFETQKEAHIKAFTVAKATRLDVLQSIRNAMQTAIDKGQTQATFAKNLEPELRKLGWWGKQVVVDSDGHAQRVQLGSPRRLKTIYNTNMATTYNAARYRQQLGNVGSRPYWMYLSRRDSLVRPEHAALDGKVFRYDDSFWNTHYPPNGWNCRCRIRALTAEQVKKRGVTVEKTKGKLTEVQQEAGIDKRTGEVVTISGTSFQTIDQFGKSVTMTPDAGWSYNPGKDFALWDKNGGLSDDVIGLVKNQQTYKDFGLTKLAATAAILRSPTPERLPKANSADEALAQVKTALAIPEKGWREVNTPESLDNVVIADSYLPHIVEKRADAREQFANYILPTLNDPLEVWLAQYSDGSFRRRFVKAFDTEDAKPHFLVARENKDGSILYNFITSKRQDYVDSQRKGLLLYRKSEEVKNGE